MPRFERRALLRLVLVAALCPLLFGAGPDYVGCGGPDDPPGDGVPLPEAAVACEVDADCPVDACAQVRCLASVCTQVAPMIDADGDGTAPPPCGGDCDDSRAEVGPGFGESCDGLDNDCNMLVDDGASRIDRVYPAGAGNESSIVVPWGDRFLVTNMTRVAIFGALISVGGEIGRPFEIQRLVRGAAFRTIAAAPADDGRVLFVSLTDDALVRYVIARPDGDDFVVIDGPADLESGLVDIQAIDVIPFAGDWAIGLYGRTDTSAQRVIMTDVSTPPSITLDVMAVGTVSFAIATDGTHLVMPDTEDGLHFFLPTGEEVVGFTLPGLSRARRPIASWRDAVVAITADAFDYNIGFVDSIIGLGSVEPAPFGEASDQVFVHSTSDLVFVSRLGRGGMRVQGIQSDLSTYDGESVVLDVGGAPAESVSVAETPVAVGAAGGNLNGVALAVLGGCAP